jgi:heterodisulfide reductase subunit D
MKYMEKDANKKQYSFKIDYRKDSRIDELYPRDRLMPGKGIYEKITITSKKQRKHDSTIEEYDDLLRQCVTCGSCRYVQQEWSRCCPSGEFGKFETYYLGGKNQLIRGLRRGEIKWDRSVVSRLFMCMLCGACQVNCQVPEIHHYAMDWLEAAREEAVKQGFGPMPKSQRFGEWIAKERNPYIEANKDRLKWLTTSTQLPAKAEIVYFVGCTASYRQKNIANATFNVMKNAGVDFTIMKDEWCCGSPTQRTGQRKISEEVAKHNVESILRTGAKTVITSCSGCYRTIKEDYKERYHMPLDLEIIHSSAYALDIIKKGKLKLGKELPKKVTYHDPCHLGRHMGVYEEPRELLAMIPGIELIEMPRNRQWAWCCGSGAGVKADFPDLANFASAERVKEAINTGAEILTSACPFCYRGLRDGADHESLNIEVYDVIELVDKSMKKG